MSLLDAIAQVPSYAKFLKDLCTKKRATNVPKKAFLIAHMSSILSNNNFPIKYKELGCPTISCTIGSTLIKKCLLDLGSSINLLPLTVYHQLGLSDLKPTRITLQLEDRSVKVPQASRVIGGDTREVCAIGSLVEDILEEYETDEELEELFKDMSSGDMFEELNAITAKWDTKPDEIYLESRTVTKSSIIEAPKLDLKPLPSTLKYVFLGENDTLFVIVASDLTYD
ncbi:uncharacterized protein LOC141719216 [Apium graveolens]|uniref:uncharacterized protein LOC141719216 n=1 Tax=Apium graveolens TaxID=4045 RepID=UPI003D7928CD